MVEGEGKGVEEKKKKGGKEREGDAREVEVLIPIVKSSIGLHYRIK